MAGPCNEVKQPYDRVPGVDAVVLGLTEHDRVKHSSKSTTCEDILRQKHTVRDCGPPLSLFPALEMQNET